jgi:hypothetical protein
MTAKFSTTPNSDHNGSSSKKRTAVTIQPEPAGSPESSRQLPLSISSSIQMDPLSTPLISESENDFEVNIEQQAATLNLWDTGFGILVTIMVVAATFFSITRLILFVLGSFYVASSI